MWSNHKIQFSWEKKKKKKCTTTLEISPSPLTTFFWSQMLTQYDQLQMEATLDSYCACSSNLWQSNKSFAVISFNDLLISTLPCFHLICLPFLSPPFFSLPVSSTASSTSRAGLWCIDVGSPSPAPSPSSNGLTHRHADAGTTELPSILQSGAHASHHPH